jgi:cytochrome o ubiquinol oxidase operon protein cyoD
MSVADETHGRSDSAPDQGESGHEFGGSFVSYLVGLGLAALLTIAAFALPATGVVWGPAVPVALVTFAIAQMGVHLVFFLHMTTSPDNTNNALALAFGVLIVFLVIGGSLWIMGHLNHNMPPMGAIMDMQR